MNRYLTTLACMALMMGNPVQAADNKLTLSTGNWVGYGALYLARDLGYFKDQGLTVELVQLEDAMALNAMLVSGQVDGSAAEVDIMLTSRKSVCTKAVVALDDSSGADGLVATNDITSLSDLKGKTIAAVEPGQPNVFFSYILRKAGLTRNDVTELVMEPSDAAAAFMAGRVPVAVTYEPSLTFITEAHKGHILFDSSQAPGLIADFVNMRCDIIDKRRADVQILVDGILKADEYIKTNPTQAYGIMRKYVGGFLDDTDKFAHAAKGVTYYDGAKNLPFMGTPDHPGTIMQTVDFIYDVWGPIIPRYSYTELFDPSFLRR